MSELCPSCPNKKMTEKGKSYCHNERFSATASNSTEGAMQT